ncbi:hypothetical protein [Herbidospora daliensis]|uniref:hypothetical protein n=1 Tax=Herbidospora daliensis TaxID=295585 RepID=UPI000782FFAB|nr:hypothetical protein [Herbidospora daliensis]
MTTAVHRLTVRVSRERALDRDIEVWYARPVDAPIRSGVSAETLTELRDAVNGVKHFILDVSADTAVEVDYQYDRELLAHLDEAGLSAADRAALLAG